jgi:hypothetical protein
VVLRDELLDVVHRGVGVGLVVQDDEFDLALHAVDLDAACVVHQADSVLVAPLLEVAEAGERAGQGD